MRILMVQRFDLRRVACAVRITAMAEELALRGHQVTLTDFPNVSDRTAAAPLRNDPAGCTILALDRRGTALRTVVQRVHAAAADADVVHLWKCYPDAALPALLAAYRRDLPLHYDWDDWETGITGELLHSPLATHLVQVWERRVPRLCTTLTVASQQLQALAEQCGVPRYRLWLAPVGARLLRQPLPAEREALRLARELAFPTLLYVGALEVAAYVETGLEVLARVRGAFPEARLIVVGGGTRQAELTARAAALGLASAVVFTGYVPRDDVEQWCLAADIALAPFADTLLTRCKSPLKVVEYLAAGLPVVGSRVGEVPRMLEGCGEVVPPGDVNAMAEAVIQLAGNEARRERLAQHARERLQDRYTWRRTVDTLLEAYQEGQRLRH